jgi:hypothetical protein
MSRRVEPGTFRIHVGGTCPTVPDGVIDRRKEKIGYYSSEEGISGEFTELKEYAPRFVYKLESPERVKSGQLFAATVAVRNEGNLTDVTETRLFAGSELASWSFELRPGEGKSHTFHLAMYKPGNLSVVAGTQIVSSEIAVEKTSARLEINGQRMQINQDSAPQVTAEPQDAGSEH